MPESNQVSIQIPPEVLQEIQTAVTNIQTKLAPYLIALSPEERHQIPKMSDKTTPFVEKTISYTESNPQFAPPYMKADEMKIDFDAVQTLKTIFNPLNQLVSNLDDSIMLSGSEAYIGSLAYYNSVKLASKMDVPGAKPICDDLKQRFPGRK
ncbi:MAG: hypothetical protein K9J12_04015 [Melioribacteraceae bacterium]|nr:hypothetical protein [Melioribacteraceae bacterium]MCF8264700.1 hypothetical protein [Melioribacteraceae bacterium]MCF8412240.1 hypothetical protein [Melioribacteraceae bacterium]MCF8431122.1 hypothetical protein [Melioribacteraceae bacterium]